MGFCCLMGLFDGCFITMIGPIAYDICGPNGAGQGIGNIIPFYQRICFVYSGTHKPVEQEKNC